MHNCKQITELSSQQMETQLPLLARLEIKFHFLMCGLCRRYARQLSIMHKALVEMDNNIVDTHLSTEAKQRISKTHSSSCPANNHDPH